MGVIEMHIRAKTLESMTRSSEQGVDWLDALRTSIGITCG